MASEQTRLRIAAEKRAREWREMWSQIGRLTGTDTRVMVGLVVLDDERGQG